MSSSTRDYQAIVDGTVVAMGPIGFVCGALGISQSTARKRWMNDDAHRQWGSIDPLPYTWRVGGEELTTDRACKLLGCSRKALTTRAVRGYGVERVRVKPWSLDRALVRQLVLKASSWHRSRDGSPAPKNPPTRK